MIDQITFIIASFNDPSIVSTLNSIVGIAHKDDQIIVVDGNSTDDTVVNAAEALRDFNNSEIVSEKDSGIYDAWNKGLKRVENTWVTFIGCGDLLRADYRKEMLAAAANNPKANLIHTRARFYLADKNDGRPIKMRSFGKLFDKAEFKRQMRICHVGALHHRGLFENDAFSTHYRCVSDYHFLLKKIDQLTPIFVDKILIDMEASGISMTSLLPFKEELAMKKELGGNGLILTAQAIWKSTKFSLFRLYNRRYTVFQRNTADSHHE